MVEHIVAFKFNENYTPEKGKLLVETLLAFKGRIPGIIDITAGLNVTEESSSIHKQGYQLGLRVTFEDQEALRQYGPHAVHQHYVSLLDGIIDNVVVIDYPIAK
jgi:hypothetical protein